MSDTDKASEATESPEEEQEEREYEVGISGTFTTYLTVTAVDEDEAHDKAKEEVRFVYMGDWEDGKSYDVFSADEVKQAGT